MKERSALTVNATMCYILAFLCTTILHELAHAIAGLRLGSEPVLYHNYVQHLHMEELTSSQIISIALAGPLTSLLQGLIAAGFFLKIRSRGLPQLLLLWISVLGFTNFLGYVMTGPFFKAGDIGKAYALSGTGIAVQIILAILAALALLLVANRMSRPFLEFSYKENWIKPEKNAVKFSFSILFLPWMIGSVMITFLYLPVVHIVSMIYPIMSGMIFIYPWRNAATIKNVRLSEQHKTGEFSAALFGVFVVIVVIFRWVFPPGIAL
jgi:hypothetical protein